VSNETCLKADPSGAGPAIPSLPKLTKTLEELCVLGAQHRDSAVLEGCRELETKLREHALNVVVIGQFKRGKTSFLNALIGKPVLPVAVVPLTSVVTVLRHGDDPRASVHFRNGEMRHIAMEEIGDFATETGNPHNRKGVGWVEIFYPSEQLRDGVRLIDTPGIGSVHLHNSQVTYDFVARIDAAIFLTSPDPPLTPVEVELLSRVASQVPKLFLVLNKTDLVNPRELDEVAAFVKRHLPEAAAGLRVIPLSAKLALEAIESGDRDLRRRSGFAEFEEQFRRFLEQERNEVFLRSAARRIKSLILETELGLKLETQAILTPLHELQQRAGALEKVLKEAEAQEAESGFILRGNVARLRAEIQAAAREFALTQVEPVRKALLEQLEQRRCLKKRQLAAEMDRELRREIESRFELWLGAFEQEALGKLRLLSGRFRTAVNGLIHQVRETAGTLFGLDLRGLDAEADLTVVASEGYYTDRLLDWGIGSLPVLLPGPLYIRYLRRQLYRQAAEELERNATRRAYDLSRRLEEGAFRFHGAVKERLDETIGGIRAAIDSALRLHAEGEEAARAAAGRLEASIRKLEELRKGLGDHE
jgi:ribosome biogenesis GTPase A